MKPLSEITRYFVFIAILIAVLTWGYAEARTLPVDNEVPYRLAVYYQSEIISWSAGDMTAEMCELLKPTLEAETHPVYRIECVPAYMVPQI